MKVNKLMSPEVKCCSKDTSLYTVAMMMWEGDCGSIAVIDENKRPIGMVTDRDIAMSCALNHKAPWELSASTITGNQNIHTCSDTDDMETALSIMEKNKVRRLPVTNTEGQLTGLMSIDDIIFRSQKGKSTSGLSYEATMGTLKAVSFNH